MGGCKDCDAPQQIAVHILSVRLQEGLEVGHFDWDGYPGGCPGVDGGQGIVGCQGKDVVPGKIRPGPLEDIWIDPECAPWLVGFHYRELKKCATVRSYRVISECGCFFAESESF